MNPDESLREAEAFDYASLMQQVDRSIVETKNEYDQQGGRVSVHYTFSSGWCNQLLPFSMSYYGKVITSSVCIVRAFPVWSL